jgi:hypothetical protein
VRFFHWDNFDKTAMTPDFGRKTILERKPGSASATPRTVQSDRIRSVSER